MPSHTKKKSSGGGSCAQKKMHTVMSEYKHHTLKGGAGHHPKVSSRKQAIAIAMSEARKACGSGSVKRK